MSIRRINKQLLDFELNPVANWAIIPDPNNILQYHLLVFNIVNTPYADGTFKLEMILPENYPFSYPRCKFITKIYHLNITQNGEMYLPFQESWTPMKTISRILPQIKNLLQNPDPETYLNQKSRHLFVQNRAKYDEVAKQWTKKYSLRNPSQFRNPSCFQI